MNRKKTLLLSLGILLAGGGITWIVFMTEPEATREGATRESAMLVEVTAPEKGSFRPVIIATGTVRPEREIRLSPRISGRVMWQSASFVPGGRISKGALLLQIESADYEHTVQLRKSDLGQARADLRIEMGRQEVARQDYQLLGDTIKTDTRALVLREPQLMAAQARVEAAEAALRQAELDLRRTKVEAPFDAQVLRRNANVGSLVAPGDELGRLVGIDYYWVVVSVPLSVLKWLSVPGAEQEKGSEVKIMNRTAWDGDAFRKGHLYKIIGALDDQTRLARLLVRVADPLALQQTADNVPALMIGTFVEVHITANEIPDVMRLNRDYVREKETVWVMKDNELNIRRIEVVFYDSEYAYISEGLEEHDQIVKTNLSTVVEGVRLRRGGTDASADQDIEADTTTQ